MSLLEFASGSHSITLLGVTLSFGPSGVAAVAGWALFASGAFCAVRERVTGKRLGTLPPLVGAGATLAAMSTGLGLLLGESYPTFAREFCFPYALLALAVAVLGRALQAGGRPLGEE
ncbi:MAG: hypothetical protein DMD35_00240 [Gemmatimonadetes bacterium]|nr:MAG: hypothetical protein DMD35_00240 [Gemmatimonadota bacterium]